MKDHQPEPNANPEAEESVTQKGLSKEAWAAVSAIAVALISGAVAIITIIIPEHQIGQPSPSPSESVLRRKALLSSRLGCSRDLRQSSVVRRQFLGCLDVKRSPTLQTG